MENPQIVNEEVLDTLKLLLKFCDELCEDVKISKHYPSAEKARHVINKYESMLTERQKGQHEGIL